MKIVAINTWLFWFSFGTSQVNMMTAREKMRKNKVTGLPFPKTSLLGNF